MTATASRTAPERPRHLFSAQPDDVGLYRAENEHDACGVAMVATMRGSAGHDIIEHALTALRNLDHRGATGADPLVGDGAGILSQVPDAFLREVVEFPLPGAGAYAVGLAFLPVDEAERAATVEAIERIAAEESLTVLGWRDVPIAADIIGEVARECMPHFAQLFVSSAVGRQNYIGLDRFAFCLRKRAELETDAYFASLSSRTLVYKGMLTTAQLEPFFPDLSHRSFESELALVHSRFSTNTFPSWPRSHPYRFIAHNGEINTVKGNRNWMSARESQLTSDIIPGDLDRLFPICTPGASDSASFDEVLELLHLGGRSLPARGADDDPGGLGEPHRHGPRPAGVLRVPLDVHGAVGRPRLRRLHRRHAHRRRPRPQRPAAGPVCGDRRRARRARLRVGCPRPRPCQGGQARPAPARSDVPRRHRARPDHRRRGDQVLARVAAPLRRVAARRPARAAGPARA